LPFYLYIGFYLSHSSSFKRLTKNNIIWWVLETFVLDLKK